MAKEGLRYQVYSRRAMLMAGGQAALLTALGGRLYYLSVVKGDSYRLRADQNRINLRLITPTRGEVLDRNGKKLATSRQDFQVFLIPEEARNIPAVLKRLSRIVNLSEGRIKRIMDQIRRQRKFVPVTVVQGLDWDSFSRINVLTPDLPGVIVDSGMTRHYPLGKEVAHIVGYVGSPSQEDMDDDPLLQSPGFKVGREGLERRYEQILRGKAGTRRVEVNAVGREIRELKPRQDAQNGDDLRLTLDIDLQQFTAQRLGAEAAGAVVMDVKSGEVLSIASAPAFDPNDFNLGMSVDTWNGLLEDPRKPLLNKCLAGQYPPGSTIKMVVALAGLEKGIITADTKAFCNGKHKFGDRVYHCWEDRGHGRMDLLSALRKSCDIYFYKFAEKLDIDDLADVARRYGLGQKFDIELDGEKSGLVPDRAWKRTYRKAMWHQGETLNTSIGQGAMLATPLQLAVMVSRLATNRAVEPRLVAGIGEDGDIDKSGFALMDVNPNHLKLVQEGMAAVMRPGGTAYVPRAKSKPVLAGKTGTAQVRRISMAERQSQGGVIKNNELPWESRDHALFVGYAPYDDPKVAVSVLVQHGGGGSSVAAPIARDLMDKALEIRANTGGQNG